MTKQVQLWRPLKKSEKVSSLRVSIEMRIEDLYTTTTDSLQKEIFF